MLTLQLSASLVCLMMYRYEYHVMSHEITRSPQGSVLLLRIEFLRCQLMVKSTEKDNQADMYSKSAVEVIHYNYNYIRITSIYYQ